MERKGDIEDGKYYVVCAWNEAKLRNLQTDSHDLSADWSRNDTGGVEQRCLQKTGVAFFCCCVIIDM